MKEMEYLALEFIFFKIIPKSSETIWNETAVGVSKIGSLKSTQTAHFSLTWCKTFDRDCTYVYTHEWTAASTQTRSAVAPFYLFPLCWLLVSTVNNLPPRSTKSWSLCKLEYH